MKTKLFYLPHSVVVAFGVALLWPSSVHATTVKFGGLADPAGADINTTWTCPAGVTSIKVECWGGGGAGGASKRTGASGSAGGGGGAAGCYSIRASVPVTPGTNYTIFVPARVSGPAAGSVAGTRVNGSSVSFTGDSGVTVTAVGGQGGASVEITTTSTTGAKGVASTAGCVGDTFYIGGDGGSATTAGRAGMGGSAPSDLGAGTNAVANPADSTTQNAGATGSDADHKGGNGAAGRIAAGAGAVGGTVGGGGGGSMVSSATQTAGGGGSRGQILITYLGATVTKTNNTDNLNLGTSWVGGNAPDSSGVAKWDNTVTTANTVSLGADATWGGIYIANPGGLVTINGGNTLTLGSSAFDLSSATADLSVNCPLALGAANVWNVTTSRTLTLGGAVSGSFNVTKQGAGQVTLSAANSYIGTTAINGGTLGISGSGTLGNTANGVTLGGGQLDLGASSQTVGAVSVTGAAGSGDTIKNGSLTGTSYSASLASGTAIISANLLVNASAGFAKSGAGAVTLSGNNTYTGTTAINAGRINAQHANALGDTAGGTTVAQNATLQLQGGLSFASEPLSLASGTSTTVLLQNGSGDNTWNGTIGTSGSGQFVRISSDSGLLTLANTITGNDPATSVVLQGVGNILVSGQITGSSGLFSGSTGTGTRKLTSANTYSGNTTVSGGTLLVNNTTGSGTGSGAVTVTGGTLGGNGAISGAVSVNSGGTLAAGASIGTLTLNSPATNNGTIVAEITNGPSADKIIFNGTFHNLGGTLTVTNLGTLAVGTYDLFDFNGGAPTGVAFTTTNLPGLAGHWNTSDLLVGGTITYFNTAPTAGAVTNSVAQGGSVSITNNPSKHPFAVDADGDSLTYAVVSGPAQGTVNVLANGFTYNSTNTTAGITDTFTYSVSDAIGGSATNTMSVIIGSAQGANLISSTALLGKAYLTYLGIPGQSYVSELATNLLPPIVWTPVATNTAGAAAGPTPGKIFFTNDIVPPTSFFRTQAQ